MLQHWFQLVPNMSTTSEDIKHNFITEQFLAATGNRTRVRTGPDQTLNQASYIPALVFCIYLLMCLFAHLLTCLPPSHACSRPHKSFPVQNLPSKLRPWPPTTSFRSCPWQQIFFFSSSFFFQACAAQQHPNSPSTCPRRSRRVADWTETHS